MTKEPGNAAVRHTMHTLAGPSDFPTTRWTMVIAAADPQRSEARSTLVSLCEGYWYPLSAYVRRRGYPADRARSNTYLPEAMRHYLATDSHPLDRYRVNATLANVPEFHHAFQCKLGYPVCDD